MLKVTIARTDLIKRIEARKAITVATVLKARNNRYDTPLTYAEYKAKFAAEKRENDKYRKQQADRTAEQFDHVLSLLKLSNDVTVTVTERDEYFRYI